MASGLQTGGGGGDCSEDLTLGQEPQKGYDIPMGVSREIESGKRGDWSRILGQGVSGLRAVWGVDVWGQGQWVGHILRGCRALQRPGVSSWKM